jgi:hypothetical protein
MNVQQAISGIHAPKGVTSVIAGVMSGDFDPIRDQSAVGTSLEGARAKLSAVKHAQDTCKSDWAYWGYQGGRSYWQAVVYILEAAELVGANNLPDIPIPDVSGKVVMDACSYIEQFGRNILETAKASQSRMKEEENSA